MGYGTFGGNDAATQVYHGTKYALEAGYRHIDTAYLCMLFTIFLFNNYFLLTNYYCYCYYWQRADRTEEAVGKAVRESNVPREEIFVTTKLWQTFHEPEHVRPACERSLKLLGLDHIDLYMMHWPMSWKFRGYEFDQLKVHEENGDIPTTNVPIIDTWRAMEELVKAGLVKSIGIYKA